MLVGTCSERQYVLLIGYSSMYKYETQASAAYTERYLLYLRNYDKRRDTSDYKPDPKSLSMDGNI